MTRTLEELDQALAAVESAGLADQLQPGVFSINSAGELEEELSGKLRAKGIILPYGLSATGVVPGPGTSIKNEIVWEREGAAVVAQITAFHSIGGLNRDEVMSLQVEDEGLSAILELVCKKAPTQLQELVLSAGAKNATILDSRGLSSYAQLPGVTKRVLRSGIETIRWPGGSQTSEAKVVAAIATESFAYFTQPVITDTLFFTTVSAATSASFTVQGWSALGAPPAAHEQSFYWFSLTDA